MSKLREMVKRIIKEELMPAHKFAQGFDDMESAKEAEERIKKLNKSVNTSIKKSNSRKLKPIQLNVLIPDEILTQSLSTKIDFILGDY